MVVVNQLRCGSYLGRLWGSIGGKILGAGDGSEAPTGLSIQVL